MLQLSLNHISNWSKLWQLSIASNKRSCLSISNKKSESLRLYLIDSLPIPQVESCCDLGILIDDRLSFSAHILSVAKKASSKSFLIRRCFQSKNPSLLSSAFTSYVCPILEYLSPIWSPHSVKDVDIIENVQRRFTKLFPHLRSLPYSTRLTRLGLSSLQARRIKSDLCSCYKITYSLTVLNPLIYFTPRTYNVTRGHPFMLCKPPVRLNSSKFSFFSRVIDHWNSLPNNTVSAGTFSSFKARLKSIQLPDKLPFHP